MNNDTKKVVLGTHDSAAYKVNFDEPLNKSYVDKWEILRNLCRTIPYVRDRVTKCTLTQKFSIYNQLKGGVRALDFRVSCYNDKYFINHTFVLGTLIDCINELVEYLDTINSDDDIKIYVLIKPDWENRNTMINNDEGCCKILVDMLEKYKDHIELYYGSTDEDFVFENPFIKNFSSLKFLWFNVDNTTDFETKYCDCCSFQDNSLLNFVLSMNTDQSVRGMSNTDLRAYSEQLNPYAFKLIKRNNLPFIILFDFVDALFIKVLNQSLNG